MAKKLGPDGMPVEIPSTARRSGTSIFGFDRPPRTPEEGDSEAPDQGRPRQGPFANDEEPTRPVTRHTRTRGTVAPDYGEPVTRIAGGPRASAHPPTAAGPGADGPLDDLAEDPVVGWLVVVDGPGKGRFARLGNGQNSIGRGEGCRARLDFGDSEISRENHAFVSYDYKGNAFYVHQGSGINLVYLNNAPVLQPTRLASGDSITVGGTSLRFVPLCGDDFTWQDAGPPAEPQ